MACGSCGQRAGARTIARRQILPPAKRAGSTPALLAGATRQYKVMSARGTDTNRRFTTLIGAQNYANRIGGTVQPV